MEIKGYSTLIQFDTSMMDFYLSLLKDRVVKKGISEIES